MDAAGCQLAGNCQPASTLFLDGETMGDAALYTAWIQIAWTETDANGQVFAVSKQEVFR